jgi:hypothetical protein
MARGVAAVTVFVVLAQLFATGLYLRYWIPVLAVVTLPVAAAFGRVLSERYVPVFWSAMTLIASLAQVRRTLNLLIDRDAAALVRTALGLEARRTFLLDQLKLYPLYDQVNRGLAPSSKVMLSCYCSGFYIDRTTFCAETAQGSLRLTNWDDFAEDLRRLGVTHVIAPSVLANGGPSPALDPSNISSLTREMQYRLVRRLLTSRGHAIATAADQGLYELDAEVANGREEDTRATRPAYGFNANIPAVTRAE